MHTVSDIVEISGKKKSIVYRDIKNGKLTKKGKFIIEDKKFHEYLAREKHERVEQPKKENNRAKYTPPPPNHKTSLDLSWEKNIKHVSEHSFERDYNLDEIDKNFTGLLGRVLKAIELLEPEKHFPNKDLQREVRDWVKIIGTHINKNRDIEAKKDANAGGESMLAFKEIRDATFKEADSG